MKGRMTRRVCLALVMLAVALSVTPRHAWALPASAPHISYRAHVQGVGWQDWVGIGKTSGTVGEGRRLEAIRIKIEGGLFKGSVEYRTHVQGIGWQDWVRDGALAGTEGQSRRIEALQVRFVGEVSQYFGVYYRVHAQGEGWMDYAADGAMAGTSGFGKRLEAMTVAVSAGYVPPSGKAYRDATGYKSGLPALDAAVRYQTHVQSVGWQGWKTDGQTAGTSGRSLRLEGIRLALDADLARGGIRYRTHVQGRGWMNWASDGATAGTVGEGRRLEAIQICLTGAAARRYRVWYRVHAQHFGWLGWAMDGESAGTAGHGYRLEAIEVKVLPIGSEAPGSTKAVFWQSGVSMDSGKFKTYTITYEPNGATSMGGGLSAASYSYNMSVTVEWPLSSNRFVRDGYIFTGWNSRADGTGTSYAERQPVTDLAKAGETIVLYAQWRKAG